MDKLTLVTIWTPSWRLLMPLLAHFGFVILMWLLRLLAKFMKSVGVSTLVFELALSGLHEVSTKFRLVVEAEVLDISDHLCPRAEIHLLFDSLLALLEH